MEIVSERVNKRESERQRSPSRAKPDNPMSMYGRNNNPGGLHEQHFIAGVGRYSNFSAYLQFYEHAVERLYGEVSEHNETADMAAVRLLFRSVVGLLLANKADINVTNIEGGPEGCEIRF